MPEVRRFPPPWSVKEQAACFELLLLFHGLVGLHVCSAPGQTSLLASGAPCLTSLVASGTPRFTSFLATGAPRDAPLFTPCHTGRCWSAKSSFLICCDAPQPNCTQSPDEIDSQP
jgi:hypothetical protein